MRIKDQGKQIRVEYLSKIAQQSNIYKILWRSHHEGKDRQVRIAYLSYVEFYLKVPSCRLHGTDILELKQRS